MSKTHVRAAIIGGLVVFIWGMLSWMVLPWHQSSLKKFSNESEVADVIRDNASTSGVYILPNTFSYGEHTSHKEMKCGMKMIEDGPYVFASVRSTGMGKMSLGPFICSLITQIIGAYIVVWMLMQTKGLSFGQKVGFVTLFGFSIALLGMFPDWIWWGFSGCFVITNMLDVVIGWFLAGLCMVKYLKR
jgi:hypothetical protein